MSNVNQKQITTIEFSTGHLLIYLFTYLLIYSFTYLLSYLFSKFFKAHMFFNTAHFQTQKTVVYIFITSFNYFF